MDLTRESGIWAGSLNWQQADTVLRVVDVNGDATEIIVPRAEISATLVDDAPGSDGGGAAVEPGVSGEVNVALERLTIDAPMTGSLRLQGEDWSWISAVVPQIDLFDGSIGAAVEAQGPLNAPGVFGNARVARWQCGGSRRPTSRLSEIEVVVTGASEW